MRGAYNQNDNSGYCMAAIIKSIPLWKSYLKATFCLIFVIIVQERAGQQAARETKVPRWFINQACPDGPSCPVKGLCWALREESTTQKGIKIHTGASSHLQCRQEAEWGTQRAQFVFHSPLAGEMGFPLAEQSSQSHTSWNGLGWKGP